MLTEQGSEVVPHLDIVPLLPTKYGSKSVTRDEFIRVNWEMAHVGPQPLGKLVIRNHIGCPIAALAGL